MSLGPQDLLIHFTVLLAAVWLARTAWRTMTTKSSGGCGSCSSGGCSKTPETKQVFTLLPPKQ